MTNIITIPTTHAQPAQAGLAGGSPQIYLPGGLATAYDAYFANVHKAQYKNP
ncbi:MAG TPA: hypothetical protein VGE45_01545 [Chloroflexia bacterium]